MDPRNLCKWSQDWLTLYNVDKCKVIHTGYNNNNTKYVMNGKFQEDVIDERDLGSYNTE